MTAYRKISLLMLVVFLLVYSVGGWFYTVQARADIERELVSVMELASSLPAPAQLAPELVREIRHLRPVTVGGQEVELSGDVPAWFARLLAGDLHLPTTNGWQLAPSDEVGEIWESFVLISCAFLLGMLLCFAALGWAVRQGLRPLAELGQAMVAIENGQLTSRLKRHELQEVNDLVSRFNSMAEALEQEQNTVRELMTELLQVQDREREHIARVLHDDLGQYVTGIRAQARAWLYDPELNSEQKKQASELGQHCETVQKHFRHLLQDLHPLVMEQLGLGAAIRHLTERWQQLSRLNCDLTVDDGLPALTGEQQTHLYRFLQEALNNISRHAKATRVSLTVSRSNGALEVEVCDNGQGVGEHAGSKGLGVRSMRERARCLRGQMKLLSQPGKGTRVLLVMPEVNV
ncbi:ATP-binding protein [Marinobacter sp.]|uniref:HAMP domain-containing sensor histidine kinase n=1 Tax=Marinobacter sp. TaxID=50741 RepID=UPI002B265747|nr:ATP-binding protein [Marinobacter sp.]